MQMYPGWSARDNYAVHKKRKKKKPRAMESENGLCIVLVISIVHSPTIAV